MLRTIIAMRALPSPSVFVLCNLSLGEYVREITLRKRVDSKKSEHYFNRDVGLQHVLAGISAGPATLTAT